VTPPRHPYEIHRNPGLKACLATKWSPFCFHNELRFSTGLLPHDRIDAETSSETTDREPVRTRREPERGACRPPAEQPGPLPPCPWAV